MTESLWAKGAKERRKQVERHQGCYIARHVVARASERMHAAFGTVSHGRVKGMLSGAVFTPRGAPLVLHPKLPRDQQQVALPFVYQAGAANEILGYIVLDRDREGEYEVVVKTWLAPTHHQIRDAAKGPVPDWYVRFKKKRQDAQP